MLRIKIIFLLAMTSFSICQAQYEDWTHVKILPSANIKSFVPLSQNEIVALSEGIIYYSDDLGETWSLLLDIVTEQSTTLYGDNNGYFYYKNNWGLYKAKPNEEPILIKAGLANYELEAIKGDTIVMFNFSNLHYSFDSGTSWQTSGFISSSSLVKMEIAGDYAYLRSNGLRRYKFSDDTFASIKPNSHIPLDFYDFMAINESTIFVEQAINNLNPDTLNIHFRSIDNGDSYERLTIPELPKSLFPKLYTGSDNSLINVNGGILADELSIYVSTDEGTSWTNHIVSTAFNETPHIFASNSNCPYSFIVTETGRLFRTTNPYSNIQDSEASLPNITLSPNPAKEYIKVNGLDINTTYKAIAYDNQGRKVIEVDGYKISEDIDIRRLAKGIYHLELQNIKTKEVQALRFIKE